MNGGEGPAWKGKSEGPGASLQAAFVDAWKVAEENGAPAGFYVVDKIKIETRNPIHSYIVIISPADD